jgi:pimeloyl-ACP methyl ester carboxylesterase
LDTAILVGASGGGVWATWYALAHPERIRGLVMLGSVPTLPGGRAPLPLRLAAAQGIGDLLVRALPPGRRMMLRMMASVGEADTIVRHPDLLESLIAGALDPIARTANLAELRALISVRGFRTSMQFTHEELRRLAVPTIMIWGDRDPVVPLAQARVVAAEISRGHLKVLPAGHVPQLGHPDRVAALLDEFAAATTSP